MNRKNIFTQFSRWTTWAAGHPFAFSGACLLILAWLITGPLFHFSDTWQLVINTATTIVTFLMVFVIQNTQNRDSEAMHLKLDELIRSSKTAHNALLDLEELSQEELDAILARYEKLAEAARKQIRAGRRDTGSPRVPDEPRKKAA